MPACFLGAIEGKQAEGTTGTSAGRGKCGTL